MTNVPTVASACTGCCIVGDYSLKCKNEEREKFFDQPSTLGYTSDHLARTQTSDGLPVQLVDPGTLVRGSVLGVPLPNSLRRLPPSLPLVSVTLLRSPENLRGRC